MENKEIKEYRNYNRITVKTHRGKRIYYFNKLKGNIFSDNYFLAQGETSFNRRGGIREGEKIFNLVGIIPKNLVKEKE